MVYNGYNKVMSNIPKMGHLPTPEECGICSRLQPPLLLPTPCLVNQPVKHSQECLGGKEDGSKQEAKMDHHIWDSEAPDSETCHDDIMKLSE